MSDEAFHGEVLGGPRPVRLAFGHGMPEKAPCGHCRGCLGNAYAERVLRESGGERVGGRYPCKLEISPVVGG